MLFRLFVALLFALVVVVGGADDNDVCFEGNDSCGCYEGGTEVSCYYFAEFATLDFTRNNLTSKVNSLRFGPSGHSVLNAAFSLAGLQLDDLFNVTFDRSFVYDSSANPFDVRGDVLEMRTLTAYFMHENKWLNESQACEQLTGAVASTYSMFANFDRVLFPQVVFSAKLCPIMFANARLDELYVDSQFLGSSRFEFVPWPADVDLNCSVRSFTISGSSFELDAQFLDRHVLKEMQSLRIEKSRADDHPLDEFLFEPFRQLKLIDFDLQSFSELLKPPTKWLRHLNPGVSVDLANTTDVQLNKNNQMLLVIRDYDFDYHFSENDLCRFYYYPHHKLVFTKLEDTSKYNCTCPLLWVMLHWKLYNGDNGDGNYMDLMTPASASCLNVTDDAFSQMVEKCQFATRFQNCTEFQTDSTTTIFTTIETSTTPTTTQETTTTTSTTSTTTTTTEDADSTSRDGGGTWATSSKPAELANSTYWAENSTYEFENYTTDGSSSSGHETTTTSGSLDTLDAKLRQSDRQILTLSVVVGALGLATIALLALSVLMILKTRRKTRSMNLLYRLTADDESADLAVE